MANITVDISRLGSAVKKDAEKGMRKVIFSVFAALDSASPLGRPELWKQPAPEGYRAGWFKANWRVVFGSVPSEPRNKNTRIAVTPNLTKFKIGKPAVIVNNAPYAERLAQGHSQQSPLGWVDSAVRTGVRNGSR